MEMDIDKYNERKERKLWMKVLERAVMDLNSKDEPTRKDAENWFNSRKYTEINSFFGTCNMFQLNPFFIKDMIFKNHERVKFTLRSIYERCESIDC
jgi:hypothetical protein